MGTRKQIKQRRNRGRRIERARFGDEELGPLQLLPGVWKNVPSLRGRGWNMIALPFAGPPGRR